jgi:hypothetical protein
VDADGVLIAQRGFVFVSSDFLRLASFRFIVPLIAYPLDKSTDEGRFAHPASAHHRNRVDTSSIFLPVDLHHHCGNIRFRFRSFNFRLEFKYYIKKEMFLTFLSRRLLLDGEALGLLVGDGHEEGHGGHRHHARRDALLQRSPTW